MSAFFGDGQEIQAILSDFLPEASLDAPIKSAEMLLYSETTEEEVRTPPDAEG